jgi:hypothetical protein
MLTHDVFGVDNIKTGDQSVAIARILIQFLLSWWLEKKHSYLSGVCSSVSSPQI